MRDSARFIWLDENLLFWKKKTKLDSHFEAATNQLSGVNDTYTAVSDKYYVE